MELFHVEISAQSVSDFADFCCCSGATCASKASSEGHAWETDLEEFLAEDALAQSMDGFNKTHLFYDAQRKPVGFVTLCASQLRNEEKGRVPLLRQAKYRDIATMLIGRFAVAREYKGSGAASTILVWCRSQARDSTFGCRFLALHVNEGNERAISFYRKHGFTFVEGLKERREKLMLYDLRMAANLPPSEATP